MENLISVITVCYNSEKLIKRTIESVLNQSYSNIEYILIDGNSTDNTLNIIKSYEIEARDKVSKYKWISEVDRGIYDAMNKAISISNGKFLNFLNAGDYYCNSLIIETIIPYLKPNCDLFYGGTINYNDEIQYNRFLKINDIRSFYVKGLMFCHQATFIRKSIFKSIGVYSEKYSLVADQEWFFRYLSLYGFKNVVSKNILIVYYDIGGVSAANRYKVLNERLILLSQYKNIFSGYPYSIVYNRLYFLKDSILNVAKILGFYKLYLKLKHSVFLLLF